MPSQLEQEVARMQSHGMALHPFTQHDGWVFLVLENYPLPKGKYNQPTIGLLVKVSPAYPGAGLDMFWVDSDLRLADGSLPLNTSFEQLLGKTWMRFSWHLTNWRPGRDNITSYLTFIDQRFALGN